MACEVDLSTSSKSKDIQDDVIIRILGLTKKYGSKKAVNNVSFDVKRGEVLGFLGPNGAGKSTTMNIITGYLSPTSGKVLVDGIDSLEDPKSVKKKIGYLPENPPLYFDMTVREYLNFVYDLKKVKVPRAEHIDRIMQSVKIDHVCDRMIKNLSKGYKQRVGLAQALVGDPEVLILDEPTVGLDPKQIIEIRDFIRELGKKRTVILSTHILQEVSAVCDRVAIISQGNLVACDTLDNISQKLGESGKYLVRAIGSREEVNAILSSIDKLTQVSFSGRFEANTVDFVLSFAEGTDPRRNIFEAFAKAEIPLVEFRSTALSLEEIFIKVTSQNVEDDTEDEQKEPNRLLRLIKNFRADKVEADSLAEGVADNDISDDEKGDAQDDSNI